MTRRYRELQAKPGELRVYYGMADGEGPDVCFANGPGTGRPDSRLLNTAFCTTLPLDVNLVDELQARGYDITTLRFSIRKKT